MLIEFNFSNYRSFRDDTCLSMEASGLGSMKNCLIPYKSTRLLPVAAILGKNGGGKSTVIRAFWTSVKFVCTAQMTQHETAPIPVTPFLLNDFSPDQPTSFEFIYTMDGIKYRYGFSATSREIVSEYLYHAPKGQNALIFQRNYQEFKFRENADTKRRQLISEAVAKNQLYFAVACTMNDKPCMTAMRWFRDCVFFSRDYTDLTGQIAEHTGNTSMLQSIKKYAINADLGIDDMQFEIQKKEIDIQNGFPDEVPDEVKREIQNFIQSLTDDPRKLESHLQMQQVTVTSFHKGINKSGIETTYPLPLSEESDGTRVLMVYAPAIEQALQCGGVFLADELEKRLHPALVSMIISKFQSPVSNPNHAQLIFTTHNTETLNMELLRKDQIYFADKDSSDGSSSLYSISDFSTTTNENMRKSYLIGKFGAIPDVEVEDVF